MRKLKLREVNNFPKVTQMLMMLAYYHEALIHTDNLT